MRLEINNKEAMKNGQETFSPSRLRHQKSTNKVESITLKRKSKNGISKQQRLKKRSGSPVTSRVNGGSGFKLEPLNAERNDQNLLRI